MSAGKDAYEERRRLQIENDLLRERQTNARLRREAEGNEAIDLFLKAMRSFIQGEAELVVSPTNEGCSLISFRMPPPQDSA